MDAGALPPDAPSVRDLDGVFHVYGVRRDDDRLLYFGEPLVPGDELQSMLWPTFREAGYEVDLQRPSGAAGDVGHVLVAEPVRLGLDGVPWTNLVLFLATVVSTAYVGAIWYHADLAADPLGIVRGWPFVVSVLGVLGIHELGHYVASRYYGVQASLPYFIPVPTIFGTMGAVIRIRGRIPSRTALFDIGIAGPIAGLVATLVVTVVGLYLPPVTAPPSVIESESAVELAIGFPPLLELLAELTGQPLRYDDPATSANPVVIAGWLGMFVTFLNLIPVGQLDGGHVTRAILGSVQRRLGLFVPPALFGLGVGLYLWFDAAAHAVSVWLLWGVFAVLLAAAGPAHPIDDRSLDRGRVALGVAVFVVGALCFTPVPIEIVAG
ncbi:MAG: site-2 protease family protein [Halobacteriales archaeon]